MSKDEFLTASMHLLQEYIEQDEDLAKIKLQEAGVMNEHIPSLLYTVRNWRG